MRGRTQACWLVTQGAIWPAIDADKDRQRLCYHEPFLKLLSITLMHSSPALLSSVFFPGKELKYLALKEVEFIRGG